MSVEQTYQNWSSIMPIELPIHPDSLRLIRSLCEGEDSPFYPLFQNLFQMPIILDTNVIISDLLWLAKKRKNPDVMPKLLNILVCGTLKAYAPAFLLEELDKNLPRLSEEHGIPLEIFNKHWDEYRPYIELVEVEEATEEEIAQAQDPKDLPYIKVQRKIGAKIYTEDTDISAMSGEVTNKAIIICLNEYSQYATVEYSIKIIGVSSVLITQGMIIGVAEIVKILSKQGQKLPSWALSIVALMIILAVAHPKSRTVLLSWIKKFPTERFLESFVSLMEVSVMLMDKHYQAQEKATKILEDNFLMITDGSQT